MMILWFVIIGILVYFLVGGNMNLTSFQRKSSEDHLDERLTKGEIGIEEYKQLKATLKERR
jgi:uncharacterized membrane protein